MNGDLSGDCVNNNVISSLLVNVDDLSSFIGMNKEEMECLLKYGSSYMISVWIQNIMLKYKRCDRFLEKVGNEGIYYLYHSYTTHFDDINMSFFVYKLIIRKLQKEGCLCHHPKCKHEKYTDVELREICILENF